MRKQYWMAGVLVAGLLMAGRVLAGSLDPTNAPGSTMHTLEEIYQKVQNLAPQSLQTLADTTTVVNAGYYEATTLTAADADLLAGNIKTNVTIFGIAGTLSTNAVSAYPAMVPKTGQTNVYQVGDDATYQTGVILPSPRFTEVNESGCVTDNLTGLVWAREASIGGKMTWSNAITYCEDLTYGGQNDWRLPNAKELCSLIDRGRFNPALPSGHLFVGVQGIVDPWWSSSTYEPLTSRAWNVKISDGYVNYANKTTLYYVWPVRGGQ